ncbi:Txe/YoeB family addiction module toxin [Microcoleus sp. ZQ-A2]|nr:Txe/YoeB family addiction module toxin [Microcoleus sp. FACHB-1]
MTKSSSEFNDNNSRQLVFHAQFKKDIKHWKKTSITVYEHIFELIEEIEQNPFKGTGHPKYLKHFKVWSRHITEKDRLVYGVSADQIDFYQCRFHYDDK